MDAMESKRAGSTVGPLDRGLAILELFEGPNQALSVADIAKSLGISKSSASRLAATLHSKRFLELAGQRGSFRLGPRVVQLASLATASRSLQRVARAHEERLARRTGETAHLGVLEGGYAITTDFVEGTHQIRMHTWIGKRTIAYASALGKALLADLDDEQVRAIYTPWPHISLTERTHRGIDSLLAELAEVRKTGIAHDRDEVEVGMHCIAAPIFGDRGDVVGALSVSGPSTRFEANYDDLVSALREEASEISSALGSTSTAYRRVA